MRKINFRAWHREKQMMCDVIAVGVMDGWVDIMPAPDSSWTTDLDDVELMQFTGLLDKNGVEIYEGDIVTFRSMSGFECSDEDYRQHGTLERPREVKYKNGEFAPREEYCEVEDGFYSWRQFDFEVIGNIHQNPDLLKLSNIEKT